MLQKAKYISTLDLERQSQGIGKPPGRITHKIALTMVERTKVGDVVTDSVVPRDLEDVDVEIQAIKDDQKFKNEEFVKRTGYKLKKCPKGTNLKGVAPDGQQPAIPVAPTAGWTMMPVVYGPLVLKLDENTGNTCCIFGSSKRGKSYALMRIYRDYYMSESKKTLIPILFAKSPQLSQYNMPDLIVVDQFKPELIEYERRINKFSQNEFNFVNFIDDFIDLKHNLTLDNLLLTYRNSNLSTYICLQYVNSLSKAGRSNVNNVLLFGQNTDEAVQVSINCYLLSYFTRMGIPKQHQVGYYHEVTKDHGFFHVIPCTMDVTICKLGI